jgi:hypothetical protein
MAREEVSMSIPRNFLLLLMVAVMGCATPKVRHDVLPNVTDTTVITPELIRQLSGVTYQATGSLLRLSENLDAEQNPSGAFTVSSVPFATGNEIYVLYPRAGSWNVTRTYLGAVYAPNTRLLYKLGVEVKDDRKQFISAIGEVAAAFKANHFLGVGRPNTTYAATCKPAFPLVLNAADDVRGCREKIEKNFPCKCSETVGSETPEKSDCGTVTYEPVPTDAILRAKYMKAVKDRWTDTFPVPACRSAKIHFSRWDAGGGTDVRGRKISWPAANSVEFETVVSDPDYVRVVKLPPKGGIAFHTSCGADIVLGDIATDPIWVEIAELGTQIKAFKTAGQEEKQNGSGDNKNESPPDGGKGGK